MKFEEYQKLSIRTNKWLSSIQFDVAHMLLGMNGEINELNDALESVDKVNQAEELADIAWYVSNYASIRNLHLDESKALLVRGDYNGLVYQISTLTDIAKKWIIYNKEIDTTEEQKICQNILSILYHFDIEINFSKALQNNIDKLKKRYPEKYSDENAQNRDLAAERKELEK
mgnify:CR=1 FL=1